MNLPPHLKLSCSERGGLYLLLARLLAGPPSQDDLRLVSSLVDTYFDASARAALAAQCEDLAEEYHRLFIGVGSGVLMPYASFYMAGSLHDRPLVEIRKSMAALGLRRRDGSCEPEDHIATVLEVMATLILRRDEAQSAAFFADHIAPWVIRFLGDLSRTSPQTLYGVLARDALAFLEADAGTIQGTPIS